MNILGFRSNKLWKKIVAITYYLFYLLIIIMVISFPHSDEILKYGTKQDIIQSRFLNISILLFFALPIIILELKYRLKFNIKKTFLSSIICFIFFVAFIFQMPENSEQYQAYLNQKAIEEQLVEKTINEDKNKENEIEQIQEITEIPIKEDVVETPIKTETIEIAQDEQPEMISDKNNEEIITNNIDNKIVNDIETTNNIDKNIETVETQEINNPTENEVVIENKIEEEISSVDNPVSQNETINESISEEIATPVVNETDKNLVWICDTGKKYHNKSTCSRMNYPYQVTKDEAIASGRDACKKCY